ncbi:MAG: hypothetical protein LBK82_11715 [Planctomycetaceae bacterium]|jgi:hypothetical protein|nr:hypothetical protein [Planctomycetaceae bacterium]
MRYFIVVLPLLLLFVGCSQTPPELRNLHPVTITVTDQGKPIENVLVSLVNKQEQSLRGCSAATNKQGVAVIVTSVRDKSVSGAAAGEYKVVLMRNVPLPEDLQFYPQETTLPEAEQEAKAAKRNAFIEKNNIIPQNLQSSETSPIDLTVEGKNCLLTIDISKY